MVMKFLEENIMTQFNCPKHIIIDHAKIFSSSAIISFFHRYNIIIGHYTTYYPQGNGLVEFSNKNLMKIIKKILHEKKKSWDSYLKYALLVDRVNTKSYNVTSPLLWS
jgi:hypothetical protein